ncbi:MAG: penicillin-binding protein [Myxococcota bacterium]
MSLAHERLGVVRLLCFAGLGLVGLRAMALSVAPQAATLDLAAIQRWDSVEMQSRRGAIVDRSGHRLATSVVTPHVVADPRRIAPGLAPGLARELQGLLEVPAPILLEKLTASNRYQRLALHVHPAVAEAVVALPTDGLGIEHAQARHYPDERLAAHVLGFVDGAGIGRLGIEATMESYLQGGRVKVERRRDRHGDGVGDPMPPDDAFTGMTVHLTLDRAVQRVAEGALAGAVERDAPESASTVVIDVKTGDVLAMASWPDFDPNRLEEDAGPRRNRAVEAAVEPGSVLKPFTLATALDAGTVGLDTVLHLERGAWRYGGAVIHDHHRFSKLSAAQVVVQSSNIGASKLAISVGPKRFVERLKAFGFGELSGIDLPAERSGVIRDAATIRPIELATTSYGQGMTATTLQLAMATATLGNEGVRMRPRLISRIEDVHGIPEWTSRPEPVGRVVTAKTAKAVVQTMVEVTAPGGPAPRGRVSGIEVAGKTGTAQKPAAGGYGDQHVASFIALAPADEPTLAVAVIVDAPSKGRISGASVAAPVASEILAGALRHVGPATPETLQLTRDPEVEGHRPPIETDGRTVPDLLDYPLRDAIVALQDAELLYTVRGSGRVVRQIPPPGTPLDAGAAITLVLQ